MLSNCATRNPSDVGNKKRSPSKKGIKNNAVLGGRAVNFRRNDFDVTNRINTTDPVCVKLEVARIHRSLYHADSAAQNRAFDDLVRMYYGGFPGYARCDTQYHDLQHVMEVTLAMARLMDGYHRARGDGPPIDRELFQLGVVCALFHDCGYIRRASDTRHRNGAAYTTTHVSRGGKFLKAYLPEIGLARFADEAPQVLHYTGYERPVESIRLADPMLKLLGSLLGSADIIAQMSDRCYLEKCRDRLYPEFVEGGITHKKTVKGEVVVFASADDLLRKTPSFYQNATKRLERDLGGAYQYATVHFGGQNHYMEAVRQNIRWVERAANDPGVTIPLRRRPPMTIN